MTQHKGAPRTPEEYGQLAVDFTTAAVISNFGAPLEFASDLFKQAMSAARAEGFQEGAAQTDWHLVEEADKDGRLMMLAWPNQNGGWVKAMGHYVKRFTEEETGDMDDDQCDFDEGGTSYWPEGWYSYYNFDDEKLLRCHPTMCAVVAALPLTEEGV